VLLGALLGYGWASRQLASYQGVLRVFPEVGSGSTSLPRDVLLRDPESYVREQAALLSSPVVLQRAVKLSGSRISTERLDQRLEVDAARDADLITIRVVDSTATGAAQLTNAVAAAYEAVVAQQLRERSRGVVSQLRSRQSGLKARVAGIDAELASRPNDGRLRAQRDAVKNELVAIERQIAKVVAARFNGVAMWERAAVPDQPISPSPGRSIAIGMLVGLLASGALAWWLGRPPSGTLTMVAAGGR
jgi:capsular polysaccharide biosynthesis protein